MKSDLVKLPGTPVCVGATPPVTVSEAGYIVIMWKFFFREICFVCFTIIRDATTERGEPMRQATY